MQKILAMLLLSCTTAIAQAAIIEIDLTDPSVGLGSDPFILKGYEFSFGPNPLPFEPAYDNVGIIVSEFAFCPGCEMYMEAVNGSVFSLYSFEAYQRLARWTTA